MNAQLIAILKTAAAKPPVPQAESADVIFAATVMVVVVMVMVVSALRIAPPCRARAYLPCRAFTRGLSESRWCS